MRRSRLRHIRMNTIFDQNTALPVDRRRETLFLAVTIAVAAIMLFLYGRIEYGRELFSLWDLHEYRAMGIASPGIDQLMPRPFIYRPLGPFLAGLLPFDIDLSFYLLNVASSIFLVAAMHRFLAYIGFGPELSSAATVLYVFNKHFFGFTSWDYFHVNDVLINIFIIVMFWSMLERRWLVFAAAMALASLTREAFLIMVPTLFVYLRERRVSGTEYARAAAATLPALAIFLLFRGLVRAESGPTLVQAFLLYAGKTTKLYGLYYLFVNPFVPLTMLPFVFAPETIRFFRSRKYMLAYFALVFAAALFGSNNERLLNPGFIVFYPLIAYIMAERFSRSGFLSWAVMAGGFLSSLHYLVARYPLPSRGWTMLLSGGSAVALTLLCAAHALSRRSRPSATG
jgi:hypothetical protein